MSDTEDVQPVDFVDWMSAEVPELADAGKRVRRQRPPRTPRAKAQPGRRFRDRRGVKPAIALIVVAAILASPFIFDRLRQPSRSSATTAEPTSPLVQPSAQPVDVEFPLTMVASTTTYRRMAVSASTDCAAAVAVSDAFKAAVIGNGTCNSIRMALYVDSQTRLRITVCLIEMAGNDDAFDVMTGATGNVDGTTFGFLRSDSPLPPGDGPVYAGGVTSYGRFVIFTAEQFFQGVPRDGALVTSASRTIGGNVALALGGRQPVGS